MVTDAWVGGEGRQDSVANCQVDQVAVLMVFVIHCAANYGWVGVSFHLNYEWCMLGIPN